MDKPVEPEAPFPPFVFAGPIQWLGGKTFVFRDGKWVELVG